MKLKVVTTKVFFTFFMMLFAVQLNAQSTLIKGFVEVNSNVQKDKLSFGFGEQDLFITSELNDRFSFLGESVFKYSAGSPTLFDVSIERIVIKYNVKGNTNILFGKHHTPINYWNDTYHHGRVFFPTIDRPQLFGANIIPLHSTGISLQAHDLGKVKLGYDLMVGNGLGSNDLSDNDKYKSVTAAVHIKPADGLRIGASYYYDVISAGAKIHGDSMPMKTTQQLFTGSIAYFHKKIEVLTEATMAMNESDSMEMSNTVAGYFYVGYKITDKIIPYVRYDFINYDKDEFFYHDPGNLSAYLIGVRYQINFLAVVKLEYEHDNKKSALTGNHTHTLADKYTLQFAIGF